jgi:hypothetical protein
MVENNESVSSDKLRGDSTSSQRLNELASKDLDRRIKEAVEDGIARWERRRIGIALLVLGLFGLATFTQVQAKLAEYFASGIKQQLDEEVKKKTASISSQDPELGDLKIRLADVQKRLDLATKSLGSPVPRPPPPPAGAVAPTPTPATVTAPATGFAFFGIRAPDGSWLERYFSIADGGDRPPQSGDEVAATASVNVRSGYIVYGANGWTNQRAVGVLRAGDKIKVVEAREVTSGFWWISFAR